MRVPSSVHMRESSTYISEPPLWHMAEAAGLAHDTVFNATMDAAAVPVGELMAGSFCGLEDIKGPEQGLGIGSSWEVSDAKNNPIGDEKASRSTGGCCWRGVICAVAGISGKKTETEDGLGRGRLWSVATTIIRLLGMGLRCSTKG